MIKLRVGVLLFCFVSLFYSGCRKMENHMEDNLLSNFEVLQMSHMQDILNLPTEQILHGPVGYFEYAHDSYKLRVLPLDGDGKGGIAFANYHDEAFKQAIEKAINDECCLWVIIRGTIEQYVVDIAMERTVMPDAFFTDFEILHFYQGPMPNFPRITPEP